MKKYITFFLPFLVALVSGYLIHQEYLSYAKYFDTIAMVKVGLLIALFVISMYIYSINMKEYPSMPIWVFIGTIIAALSINYFYMSIYDWFTQLFFYSLFVLLTCCSAIYAKVKK